jgi:hypothetical protein
MPQNKSLILRDIVCEGRGSVALRASRVTMRSARMRTALRARENAVNRAGQCPQMGPLVGVSSPKRGSSAPYRKSRSWPVLQLLLRPFCKMVALLRPRSHDARARIILTKLLAGLAQTGEAIGQVGFQVVDVFKSDVQPQRRTGLGPTGRRAIA